ncbi:MAG: hypothetical protein JXB15_03345 [Anaerolineales bacterium]|nr:hypothetical protein [Anaerolineales bacterium]
MRRNIYFLCALLLLASACEFGPQDATPQAAPTATFTPAATLPPTPAIPPGFQPNTAYFRDRLAVMDAFILYLTGVTQPPAGQVYQAWLFTPTGEALNLGAPEGPDADGLLSLDWASPSSENLAGRYTRFQLTLESAAGGSQPAGQVAYAGELDEAALPTITRLFVRNDGEPATPQETALAAGLQAGMRQVLQLISSAASAAQSGGQAEMRLNLEQVINLLEGAQGAYYQDYDGDGTVGDPGDGFGVKGYAWETAILLGEQADPALKAFDDQANGLQELCAQLIQLASLDQAAEQMNALQQAAKTLQNGPTADLYGLAQAQLSFAVEAP